MDIECTQSRSRAKFLVVELIRHFSNLNVVLIGVHVVKFTFVNFTFIRLEEKKTIEPKNKKI